MYFSGSVVVEGVPEKGCKSVSHSARCAPPFALSSFLSALGQRGAEAIGDQRDSPGRRLYNVSSAVVLVSCSQPRGVRPLPAFVARAEIIALARFGTRSTATPPLLPAGEFRSDLSVCLLRCRRSGRLEFARN
jgi:hypothetical protein